MLSLFCRKKEKPNLPPIVVEPTSPGFYTGDIVGATESERALIVSAIDLLNTITRSDLFAQTVRAARFTSANGLTSEQILENIKNTVHVCHVKIFNGSYVQNYLTKTKAIDKSSDDYVHLNRFFLGSKSETAASIIHERAHAMGFHHKSASERTSVPYQLGDIVTRMGRIILGQ